MKTIRITMPALLFMLAGCASVPEPLTGDYSQSFHPEEATEQSVGARLRWGGTIVDTRPGESATCVEVLAHPLDRRFRPERSDADLGRFLACRDGFLDPEIFSPGREVTATGRLTGFQDGSIGEYVYSYPRLEAGTLYLWPERTDAYYRDRVPYSYWPWYPAWPYYHHVGFYRYYPNPWHHRVHDGAGVRPQGDTRTKQK
ncbi:MAG: Slp family lipoprotein [Wenzhouxiangellaceae bacterium]|nr:Slp family lipoprotein [Wenzhouxiangellaceae bacterium]